MVQFLVVLIIMMFNSGFTSGTAPIGFGNSVAISQVNNGSVNGSDTLRTLYFRKVINVTEAACYAKLNFTLYAKDGAVRCCFKLRIVIKFLIFFFLFFTGCLCQWG